MDVKSRCWWCCLGVLGLPTPPPLPCVNKGPGSNCLPLRRGWEFRARGGSLWSQTAITVTSPEPTDALPSPTELPGPSLVFAPASEHRPSEPSTSRITVRRPNTLCLRSGKFLCGKNVTSPEDYPHTDLQLPTPDIPLVSKGRQPSPHQVHQSGSHPHPRTHNKYLEMSVCRNVKKSLLGKNIITRKSTTASSTPRKYINASGEGSAGPHDTTTTKCTTKEPESNCTLKSRF